METEAHYVKLVSEDRTESRIYPIWGSDGFSYGRVSRASDLDFYVDDDEFVESDGAVAWINFRPWDRTNNKTVATSGDIYVLDARGSTVEKVR